jgi:hypothetical protein
VDSRHLSLVVLQYHSRTPACSVSLPHFKLRTQLNTVLLADAFSPKTASNRPWISDGLTPLFSGTTWSVSAHDNRLLFYDSVHALRTLVLLKTQQLSQTSTTTVIWWWNAVLRLLLSAHNSRDRTACYLPERNFRLFSLSTLLYLSYYCVCDVICCLNNFHVTELLAGLVQANQDCFSEFTTTILAVLDFVYVSYKHAVLQRNPRCYHRKVIQISKSHC